MNLLNFYTDFLSFIKENKHDILEYVDNIEELQSKKSKLFVNTEKVCRECNIKNDHLISNSLLFRLQKEYSVIDKRFNNNSVSDIINWLTDVETFTTFLIFADKVLVLSSDNILTPYDREHNIVELQIKFETYEVCINFSMTKIKNPVSSNIALSMVFEQKDDFIKIMNIKIHRYATGVDSDFKFISGEQYNKSYKTSDIILLESIMTDVNFQIMETFNSILNNCIDRYIKIPSGITINAKEIMDNGFRV